MKPFLLIILSLFSSPAVFATAQNAEHIEYKGEEMNMFSTPLEEAFSEKRPRPNGILESWSTANWRGYVGRWVLKDDQLLLAALHRDRYEKQPDGSHKVTDELVPLDKVLGPGAVYPAKADWFTGTLRLQGGKQVRYVHMGFGSQYEKEILLKIEGGKLIKAVEITYDPEKDAYRSDPDMQWVALGEGNKDTAQSTDWIDGRLLRTSFMDSFKQDKRTFKTRGIIFSDDQGLYLWIPETQKTRPFNLPIHKAPKTENSRGAHVEIEARFNMMEKAYELEATTIRLLQPGETIHHPLFPSQFDALTAPKKVLVPSDKPAVSE